jgi:hypothetical protein
LFSQFAFGDVGNNSSAAYKIIALSFLVCLVARSLYPQGRYSLNQKFGNA